MKDEKEQRRAYLLSMLKEEAKPINEWIIETVSRILFNTILSRLNNLNRRLLAESDSKFPIHGLIKCIDIKIILYIEDDITIVGDDKYALKILMTNVPFYNNHFEKKLFVGSKELAKSFLLIFGDKSKSSQSTKIALNIKKQMLEIICNDTFRPMLMKETADTKKKEKLFSKKNKFKFSFSSMIDVDHFVKTISNCEDLYRKAEAKFKPRILSIFLPSDTKMPIIGVNNKTINIIINSEKTVCLIEINSYADYEYLHKLFWERKLNMPYDMFDQLSKIWGEVMISVDYGVLAEPTDSKLFTTSNGKYQMLLKNKDEVINYFGNGEENECRK